MPQPSHPRHRDLQVRFPRLRRFRRVALAHLQFSLYGRPIGARDYRIQQGAEKLYGYGIIGIIYDAKRIELRFIHCYPCI